MPYYISKTCLFTFEHSKIRRILQWSLTVQLEGSHNVSLTINGLKECFKRGFVIVLASHLGVLLTAYYLIFLLEVF